MRKAIDRELAKCKDARIPKIDPDQISVIIPKLKPLDAYRMKENKCYLIHIFDSAIQNETLRVNWNRNQQILHSHIKACFSMRMARMCKFDGIGYNEINHEDTSHVYQDLWLPEDSFEIIEDLD